MNRQTWTVLTVTLAALAVVGGMLHIRGGALVHVDANRLVSEALSRENAGSYRARVTTLTGDGSRTATVLHQGRTEKIEYPGARGRSAWSMTVSGKSYTYLPKGNQLLTSEAGSLLSERERTQLLLANYNAKCVGTDRIAGRDTYAVELTSNRGARPSKKLWIDRENRTILRTDDYSASGQLRGRTETKRIDFGAKIEAREFALPSGNAARPITICESCKPDGLKRLKFTATMPQYLPSGYKLEGNHLLHSTCGCSHISAQFTYTDGLNVISVFETPAMVSCSCCKDMKCDDQNCGIATLGQVKRGDKTVVVVGDLLPEDLRKIAESVP